MGERGGRGDADSTAPSWSNPWPPTATSTAPPWPNPWPTTADRAVLVELDRDRDLDLDPARSGRIATLDLDPARCRTGQRNYHDLRRGAGRVVENLIGE